MVTFLKSAWALTYKSWIAFWGYFAKALVIGKLYTYVLFVIGFISKKKTFPETDKRFRYGILICARNEHLVIGNLIDSIHAQDYDKDKIQIFVIADNCTDNTAEISREKGCTVYERFDKEHARKGYAMEFAFDKIEQDYGIKSFDGYIVFDADNLLAPNFITELNKAFATGVGIVVGYRNTKNFDRNFISAGYGIHFMRSVVAYHRPRAILNTSTHIAGTGYVVASRLVENGWHYTCLTEDTQFSLNSVAKGETIAFCEDAEFFDEQPYQVRVMVRQRMRWVKGRFYSFISTAPGLIKGIFTKGTHSFACYDMFFYAFPSSIFYGFYSVFFPLLRWICLTGIAFFAGKELGIGAASANPSILLAIWAIIAPKLLSILKTSVLGILVVIRERKKIHCSTGKLIFYAILFPWFDKIGKYLAVMSVFSTSQWKPIKHDAVISINDITQKSRK